jgi:hypothetical protein
VVIPAAVVAPAAEVVARGLVAPAAEVVNAPAAEVVTPAPAAVVAVPTRPAAVVAPVPVPVVEVFSPQAARATTNSIKAGKIFINFRLFNVLPPMFIVRKVPSPVPVFLQTFNTRLALKSAGIPSLNKWDI